MKQRVKNVSYLTKAVVGLALLEVAKPFEVLMLPAKAELLSLDLEVLEASDTGVKLDVGLDDTADFFINDASVDTIGNTRSSKQTQILKTAQVNISVATKCTKGKVVVRAQYFLPSEILAEF
ncbi:hypothetical protein GW575_00125 [Campylobacter sp. MIT 19-121]|uniref:hypothetical protein n=1 Tax=Campylobacter sp. MIT 19-121 TaxID=2703906 RepID=UPI001389DD47|nr:hypothetical protein [Campylobacter sp. MIT 19-121]NDJ26363.1 hypothetical protein [Campylobacter sp. MIT 19-121]